MGVTSDGVLWVWPVMVYCVGVANDGVCVGVAGDGVLLSPAARSQDESVFQAGITSVQFLLWLLSLLYSCLRYLGLHHFLLPMESGVWCVWVPH